MLLYAPFSPALNFSSRLPKQTANPKFARALRMRKLDFVFKRVDGTRRSFQWTYSSLGCACGTTEWVSLGPSSLAYVCLLSTQSYIFLHAFFRVPCCSFFEKCKLNSKSISYSAACWRRTSRLSTVWPSTGIRSRS